MILHSLFKSLIMTNDRLGFVLLIDLLDLLSTQFNLTSLNQVIQLIQTSSPNNRSGNEWFTQTPSKCYLGHTDVSLFGDSLDFTNDGLGGFRYG
jgi:hypothetical protein